MQIEYLTQLNTLALVSILNRKRTSVYFYSNLYTYRKHAHTHTDLFRVIGLHDCAGWQIRLAGWKLSGRNWYYRHKAEFLLHWEALVLLLRLSDDWMGTTYITESDLLYLKSTDCRC